MADVTTALTTAFTGIVTNLTDTLTSIIPIALGLLAITLVVFTGIKWFKRLIGASK